MGQRARPDPKGLKQAKQRDVHLPDGTVQQVLIDFRGQNPTPSLLAKIKKDIVEKSNGIIKPEDIKFKLD